MSTVTSRVSEPEVESIISSSTLNREVDIDVLAEDLTWEVSNPDEYCGLVCSREGGDASVMVFRTGEVTIVGATSKAKVDAVVEAFFGELEGHGFETPASPRVEYQNVVCSAELNQEVNLNAAAIGLGLSDVEYEPEQFNGLVYAPSEYSVEVTFLVFHTGSMVITGTTSFADSQDAFNEFLSEFEELGLLE